MSHVFSADEIFEMAEQIEKTGAKFYRDSAKAVDDDIEKNFLHQLARMEDDHLKTFSEMRKQLSGKEQEAPTFDPNHEAGMYLKSLADTKVFFEKDMDKSSLEGIYKTALLAEKDSIAFYTGMKEFVPEYFGKDKLDAIIREEMQHIKSLNEKLLKLKK